MKVLVTGGTGFIGAHTVATLVAGGHQPRLLVRSRDRLARNVGALGVDVDALDVVIGDMTDSAAVTEAATGAEAAIHAAAVVAALNRSDAERTVQVNLRGTECVLDAALAAGCDPVVHVSSVAAVYAPRLPLMTTDLPPALDAANPYTRSKGLAEQAARDRQAAGEPVTTVYPGGVLGPAAGEALGDVAEGFVSMLKSGMVPLSDGGVGIIDVRDVASVLVRAVEQRRGGRRYMAGGQLMTLTEIGAALGRVTGRRMPVLPTPGVVFRGLGRVVDGVRRVVPFNTVFTAEAMQLLTLPAPSDDSLVHDELGVVYRDPDETFEAAVRSLYDAGRISARQAGLR